MTLDSSSFEGARDRLNQLGPALSHFWQGFFYYHYDQFEEATGEFLLAIQASYPDPFVDAEVMLSRAYGRQDFLSDRLVKQLQRVVEIDPNDAASWLLLGVSARSLMQRLIQRLMQGIDLSHEESTKLFETQKISEEAFEQAKIRYPTFLEKPNWWSLFHVGLRAPLAAGDIFTASRKWEDQQEAIYWYSVAENYDAASLASHVVRFDLADHPDTFSLGEDEIREISRKAARKRAVAVRDLDNMSPPAKTKNEGGSCSKIVIIAFVLILLFIGARRIILNENEAANFSATPEIVEAIPILAVPVETEQIDASLPEATTTVESTNMLVASSTPLPPTESFTPTPASQMTNTPFPTLDEISTSGQTERISSEDGMSQSLVDEGSFLMVVNPSNADSSEGQLHEVYLDSFWIDKTEVTNAQFAMFINDIGGHSDTCLGNHCMKTKEQHELSHISSANNVYTVELGYEDHPVIMVTWYGASAYCQWTGRRLPTNAEWEKAARGDDERIFPWGDVFEEGEANFCDLSCEAGHSDPGFDDGFPSTAPVGQFPRGASPYGALDMSGNVTEYVADWFDDQFNVAIPASNPQGPTTGSLKIRRGGAWISTIEELKVSFLSQSTPDSLNNNVGFRCAQSN